MERIGKKIESKESPELFRASLGFDFIFGENPDGSKHPYCIELNGQETGIRGVQDIPKGQMDELVRTFADIRGTEDPEHLRKRMIHNELMTQVYEGTFQVSDKETEAKITSFMNASLERERWMKHAFKNPPSIEYLAENKEAHVDYIPKEYYPRVYQAGGDRTSSTGYWIMKAKRSRGGREVFIIPGEHFTAENFGDKNLEKYIFQEFIQPAAADKAAPEQREHAASLRLLMDFIYRSDGTIDPVYEVAYQRIAPVRARPLEYIHTYQEMEEAYVVNRERGAASAPASEEETRLAHEVALKIIANLGKEYKEIAEFDSSVV